MFKWASSYDKLLKIHFLLKQSLSTDLNKATPPIKPPLL